MTRAARGPYTADERQARTAKVAAFAGAHGVDHLPQRARQPGERVMQIRGVKLIDAMELVERLAPQAARAALPPDPLWLLMQQRAQMPVHLLRAQIVSDVARAWQLAALFKRAA